MVALDHQTERLTQDQVVVEAHILLQHLQLVEMVDLEL